MLTIFFLSIKKYIANWRATKIYNIVTKNIIWRRQFIINFLSVSKAPEAIEHLKTTLCFTFSILLNWFPRQPDTVAAHLIPLASFLVLGPGSSGRWISILQLKVWLFGVLLLEAKELHSCERKVTIIRLWRRWKGANSWRYKWHTFTHLLN